MDLETQVKPIASVRSKVKPPPEIVRVGAPDWMATYSDMMSLLLTFFILLFSVSETKSSKVYEVNLGFQQHFKADSTKLGYYPVRLSSEAKPGFLEDGLHSPSLIGHEGRSRPPGKKEAIDRWAALTRKDQRQVISIPGLVLFDEGRARLRQDAVPTLLRVAARLQRVPYQVKVAGHTSSRPLEADADAKDHFSLGFLRAVAVGKFLQGGMGDLPDLAGELARSEPDIPDGLENIPAGRLIYSTHSWHRPSASREALWEEQEMDDRVELSFPEPPRTERP